MRMHRKLETMVFRAWAAYVGEARAALAGAAMRWMSSAAAAAFGAWQAHWAARVRLVALGRKMMMRYRNSLLAGVFLAWAAHVAHEREDRDKSARRAMAMMSGKAELLVQMAFEAWRDETRTTASRRAELGLRFVGRYRQQLLAKCFLAWANDAAHEADDRRALQTKAAAMWSGKSTIMLQLYFDALRRAVATAVDQREELVRAPASAHAQTAPR